MLGSGDVGDRERVRRLAEKGDPGIVALRGTWEEPEGSSSAGRRVRLRGITRRPLTGGSPTDKRRWGTVWLCGAGGGEGDTRRVVRNDPAEGAGEAEREVAMGLDWLPGQGDMARPLGDGDSGRDRSVDGIRGGRCGIHRKSCGAVGDRVGEVGVGNRRGGRERVDAGMDVGLIEGRDGEQPVVRLRDVSAATVGPTGRCGSVDGWKSERWTERARGSAPGGLVRPSLRVDPSQLIGLLAALSIVRDVGESLTGRRSSSVRTERHRGHSGCFVIHFPAHARQKGCWQTPRTGS